MQGSKFNKRIFYPLVLLLYIFIFSYLITTQHNFIHINKGIYSTKNLPAYDFINKYFYYLTNCSNGIFFIGPSTVRESFNYISIKDNISSCIVNGGVSSNGDIYFLNNQLSILLNNLPPNYKIPILIIGINSRMIVDRSFLKRDLGFNDLLSIEQLSNKPNYLDQILYNLNLKKKYFLFYIINFLNKYNLIKTKNNIPVFENLYKDREFDQVRFNEQLERFNENRLWNKKKYFNQKEIDILNNVVNISNQISTKTIFYIMPYHSIFDQKLGKGFENFLPMYFTENNILFIDNTSFFNDKDFIDIGHLNEQGREKFQQILTKNIKSITNDFLP